MSALDLRDRVAIVTGAGGGLGRSHALALSRCGAKVVVNDLGGSLDGKGESHSAADTVVEEIQAAGGKAVADYGSVTDSSDAQAMVARAVDAFGKLDIVVNNAGILRDVSFKKMTDDDWDAVIAVHLTGTMKVSRAAWPVMREQNFGRIINTTSAAGLYGNFGQANYAAAKLGIVGFSKTLAVEGAKNNIRCNVVAPVAKSRMTETILPPEVLAKLNPAFVSAVVCQLASAEVQETGSIFSVGAGYVSRAEVLEAKGIRLSDEEAEDPGLIRANWDKICDLSETTRFDNAMTAIGHTLAQPSSSR